MLDFIYLFINDKIYKSEASGGGYGYALSSGILFKPDEFANLALNIKYWSDITSEVKLSDQNLKVPDSSQKGEGYYNISEPVEYKSQFPLQVGWVYIWHLVKSIPY